VNPDSTGRFVVTAGEVLTISITKLKDRYLAAISRIEGGPAWQSMSWPDPLLELRTLVVPAAGAQFNFDIYFDFRPDSAGVHDASDAYTVRMSGSISGPAQPLIVTPPPSGRAFTFVAV
jgi:hypothetical protein